MKANTIMSIGGAILVILLLLLSLSCYTVKEGQQAVLWRNGSLITDKQGNPVTQGPGLHFKSPLITQVKILDTRLQTTTINSLQASTKDEENVIVSYYSKWRIVNFTNYLKQSSGNSVQFQAALTQQLNAAVQKTVDTVTLTSLISEEARVFEQAKQAMNDTADRFGIQIVDLQAKSIAPTSDETPKIYEEMRSQWQQQAAQTRASGKANADNIRANANAKVALIMANAKLQATQIRSQGDAQAAAIYANASSKDPDFYIFLRSLEAYRKVFNTNSANTIVLKPDIEFFKYFNGVNGQATPLGLQRKH